MLDSRAQESDIAAMRRLLLLRHGKTERTGPGQLDRERELTKRGRGDAALIGAYMAKHGLVPELAVVSPARRTQETWTLLSAAFTGKKQPRVSNDERVYNASAEVLFDVIAEPSKARSLLIVGHNPSVQEVAVKLIASGDVEARERIAEKLPTSGLVVIDLPFDDWSKLHAQAGRLERFVSPRLITATTD